MIVNQVIGQIISHYKIIEKLGQGGMGMVYKAEDTVLRRTVALKFLPPAALGDEEVRARFRREAQAAAALDHPNICAAYEIDEVAGRVFIVMAYVHGEDLDQRIGRKPLKIEEALDIALGVAQGIQEAHEKGIIHRDIKPANIKIAQNGQPKVMDFGLAKLSDSTSLTKTGMTIGTAAYMSPEQTLGQAVDYRTDIWSLGVVMYQMLTGQLPFHGEYEQIIRYGILNEEPAAIRSLAENVSPELEGIVNRAIAKKPGDRYQTAAELVSDLRAERQKCDAAAAKVAAPGSVPAGGAAEHLQQRQRLLFAAVITLSALLIGAFVVIVWLALR